MSCHNKTQRDHDRHTSSLKSKCLNIFSTTQTHGPSATGAPLRFHDGPNPGGEAQTQCRHHRISIPFPGVGRSFAARRRRRTSEIRASRRSMTHHQRTRSFQASTLVGGSTSSPPAQGGCHRPHRRVLDRYSRGRLHVQTLLTSRSIDLIDLQHLRSLRCLPCHQFRQRRQGQKPRYPHRIINLHNQRASLLQSSQKHSQSLSIMSLLLHHLFLPQSMRQPSP